MVVKCKNLLIIQKFIKSHSVEKGFKTVWKTCQWFDDF